MSFSSQRVFRLIVGKESLRGIRLVIAVLSISWAIYLVSPLCEKDFINVSGSIFFFSFAASVIVNLVLSDELNINEGIHGMILWSISTVYNYMDTGFTDIMFFMVPIILFNWYVFANALTNVRIEYVKGLP